MRGPMSDALRIRIAAALLDAGPRAAHLSINFAWAEYLADAVIEELGDGDTFTFDEMRITLTAFAMWLSQCGYSMDEVGAGIEVELVDRFIRDTTSDEETTDD